MAFLDLILGTTRDRNTRTRGVTPADPQPISESETRRVVGHTGTAIYGGFIVEKEKNARLTGQQKYVTYSEMLANTAILAAGVRFFLNLIAKAEWRVEPAKDQAPDNEEGSPTSSDQAEEIADLIREMMNDMETPWVRVVRRAAMYRFYGFSIQEWTAKRRDDDRIGMRDVAPRPQLTIERWDADITGSIVGVVQRSEQTSEEIYLPRNKLVYVVDDSLNDSPEGLGLFRHVVESVQRLRRYEELEGFSFETDLRGIPIGRAPLQELEEAVRVNEITEAQRKVLEQGLEDFIKKHVKNPQLGMILDSTPYRSLDETASPSSVRKWDMELLEGDTAGQGQDAILQAIERVNREIARVLGVEQLLLGENERGSFALSRDKSNNFALIVDSTLQELTSVFDRDFVGPLMRMNGWREELRPTLKTEAIRTRDVEQITTAIKDLALAGVSIHPEDEAVKEIFDLLGLSRLNPALAEADLEEARSQVERMLREEQITGGQDPGQPGGQPDSPGAANPALRRQIGNQQGGQN